MCNVSNTSPTPLPCLSLSPNSSKVIFSLRRGCRLGEEAQTSSHCTNCFSSGVTRRGEGCLEGCLHHSLSFFPLVSGSLSLSPPPVLFRSPSLTHLSFILFLLFIVSFSGTACPLKGSLLCLFVWCFSSHLDIFLFPLSLSPGHFWSFHFSFKHLLPLSLYHTHTSPSQLYGIGSLSPPSTYHRVYYICHHLLT